MSLLHTAHLRVREDARAAFETRLRRHARHSLEREPGCELFEVHPSREDRCLFLLIERYRDEAALEAHRASPHFAAFRRDTADWVVERTWWFWDGDRSED